MSKVTPTNGKVKKETNPSTVYEEEVIPEKSQENSALNNISEESVLSEKLEHFEKLQKEILEKIGWNSALVIQCKQEVEAMLGQVKIKKMEQLFHTREMENWHQRLIVVEDEIRVCNDSIKG